VRHGTNALDLELLSCFNVGGTGKSSQVSILSGGKGAIGTLGSSGSEFQTLLSIDSLDHSAGVCGDKGGESQQVEEWGLEHLNESEGSGVREEGFVGKDDFAFFHSSDGDFGGEVLFNPVKVLILHVGEDGFEVFFVFRGELEALDELLDGLESGEDGIMAIEGVFSEEDFEGGLFFVFVLYEVGVGTGELIEIVVEEVNLSDDLG
jgi:hypothetical protein